MRDPALAGDLSAVTLAGVLQLIEAEALSGVLSLADAGQIEFSMGRPVGARCGRHSGTTALLELFLESKARFGFQQDTVSGDVLGSVLGLIMEGCRLADEWAQVGGLALVPRGDASVGGAAGEVLAALDGTRTVEAAVRHVGVARVVVADPLRELLEEGDLHEVTMPPPPPRVQVPPSEGYAQAMDEGRRRLRSGDFDGAESSFELALTLRPDDVIARQNLRRVRQVRGGDGPGFHTWRRRP